MKNKKIDFKDRLAALMIYKELKDSTNENTFISSVDLTRNLENIYGKENSPSHNTVAKYLKAMKDYSKELEIDVRRGNSKQGYCLGEREFSPWEMDLLISAAMNSKTLSVEDKRDIIFKCFNHLGLGTDEIGVIIDYLKESKDKRKKQKQEEKENIPEIFEKLDEAIKEKKQIKMFLTRSNISLNNISNKHTFYIVSPYRVFTFNDNTYLMYGMEQKKSKVFKPFVLNYKEIRDIYDVQLLDSRNYYPLEKYEPFKDGINQSKLNRDPFGYIRQKENETVQIEILLTNEYTIASFKDMLKNEFNENVEFAHKNNKQIAYISGNVEKCMQFLFWYSDICIVIGPESWKKRFKSKLIRTVMKYDSHKKHYTNMIDFINNDDYIEKAHMSMDANKQRITETKKSKEGENKKELKEDSDSI